MDKLHWDWVSTYHLTSRRKSVTIQWPIIQIPEKVNLYGIFENTKKLFVYKCSKILNGKSAIIYPFIFYNRIILAKYLTYYKKRKIDFNWHQDKTSFDSEKQTKFLEIDKNKYLSYLKLGAGENALHSLQKKVTLLKLNISLAMMYTHSSKILKFNKI